MEQLRIHPSIECRIIFFVLLLLAATACDVPFQKAAVPATVIPEGKYPTIIPSAQPLVCPGQQAARQDTFVSSQGVQLRFQGAPLKLYGYTFYPATIGGTTAWHKTNFTHYIDHILDMGKASGQNLVRPTDFWNVNDADNRQNNVTIWHNIDYLVCATRQRGMFVAMDISAFAHWLVSQRQDAYDPSNWLDLIQAVGKRYANQSSIAFYSILGEPTPPKTQPEMQHLVSFYRNVTDELARVDGGHHLITAGGFNHMEEESQSLPWWHSIYRLPHNDIVAFKTYSENDIQLLPTITAFASSIVKPAIDEEFGLPQSMGDSIYTGENYNHIMMGRAQFYQQVYSQGEENNVAGFIFWNMGCGIQNNYYEVNPQTTAVWNVVQEHAPEKPDKSRTISQICPSNNY